MTVSITDEIADLTLDQLARAAAMQAAPQVRRRPPTSMVFCKKLRLEGPWGTVRHGDIVSRWHPAVAGNEEWFVETSVGYDPGLDSELETRTIRVAEFKTRRSRPSAGRAISRRFITPAPHPSPSKRVEGPWMVTLRPDAKARFTIHLGGETARTILAEVADVSHEGLETGGLLFSSCCSRQPRGRGLGSCSASAC